MRCNAKALETGAILVDLPGVADANAARNSIAKDYMKARESLLPTYLLPHFGVEI
jgi:hypothetical protein